MIILNNTKLKVYVKATGANRYAGGSCNWLLVRDLQKIKNSYFIEVKIKYGPRYIDIPKDMKTPNLIFKTENNGYVDFKDIVKLWL